MTNEDGNTPIFYAVTRNNPQILRFLLKNGADPNMICERETGNTAVHLSFKKDSLLLIIACLQYGADLYKRNISDETPVQLAKPETLLVIKGIIKKARQKSPSCREFYDILKSEEAYKKKKYKPRKRQMTALAKYLYQQEITVKVKSGQKFINRKEFLFEAARINNFDIILNNEFVIQTEDCTQLDYYGRSAICYALHHDNIQFTKFLLAHGTDVNKVCDLETGDSAVHLAFRRDKLMIILLVLQKSADLNLLNKDQLTPIDLAKAATLAYLHLDRSVNKNTSMNLSRLDF